MLPTKENLLILVPTDQSAYLKKTTIYRKIFPSSAIFQTSRNMTVRKRKLATRARILPTENLCKLTRALRISSATQCSV